MLQDDPRRPAARQSPRAARRANLLFFAAVLAAALAMLGWQLLARSRAPAAVAVLTYGSSPQAELRIPLDTDARYDVDTGLYTVHIQVQGGAAAFVESPCPDHTCEGFGWLSEPGQWAACLPAQAMLQVEETS